MKKFSSIMKGSSRRPSWIRRHALLLILGGSLITAWYLLPRVLLLVAAAIVYPVSAFNAWLHDSSGNLPTYLRDRGALVEEMNVLENKLVAATGDQFTMRALEQENERLRELLGHETEERIMAGVIGRPPRLPYDVLLLDRGSEAGVVVGAPVYSSDRTVIGYVSEVTTQYSVATLITSPQFKSTVYLIGPNVFSTAEGIGGGQLRIGVPQGIDVAEGDLVVIPAVHTGVYGTVHHIERTPTQPQQYAYVAPQTAIASLRLVSVGRAALLGTSFETASANVSATLSDLFTVPVPDDVLIDLTSTSSIEIMTATSSATTSSDDTVQ